MDLNYRYALATTPNDRLPIVLIHGLFGSLDNLGVLARPLGEDYPTLQVDLRNHGLSPHSDDINYDLMAGDVIALLDKLNIAKCILIGHSMGGKVAMTLSALQPERIDRLVVIDIAPVAYPTRHHDDVFAALRHVSQSTVRERPAAASLMKQDISDSGTIPFLLKSFIKGTWRFNVDALWAHYNDIIGWQESAPWHGPVLFIRGGNSPYLSDDYRPSIQRQFPHARAHVIAGAGHWVHAEKPDAVMRAIGRFLTA